ncbi:Factor arrest protein 11 [Tulasnella sp. 419]|nr:Factor arrest protein 11 [Tulasnella sp. 419]
MDTMQYNITAQEKAELLEEVNTEVSVYLGMLYFLVEIFREDEEFGEELMSMEPPLPVYLFGLVSALKEKSARGYPVKKLLLLFWKSLLCCLGGIRHLQRVKKLGRELSGLPSISDSAAILKSSPIEFSTFRAETSVKYPTFSPGPPPDIPADKLAAALAPIPVRPHYHHANEEDPMGPKRFPPPNNPNQPMGQGGMQPATPAPTPPQSPKPKKQQFQTDPTRPFLFPFSRIRGSRRLVPFAIDEADKLFAKHMHISLALYQMWRTREDCILDESGLDSLPPSHSADLGPGGSALLDKKFSIVSVPSAILHGGGKEGGMASNASVSGISTSAVDEEEPEMALPDVVLLENAIKEAEEMEKIAEDRGSKSEKKKAAQRKADLIRLRRVETIYRAVLPQLSSWVVVLLKLLLATVTAAPATGQSVNNSQFPSTDPPPQPPPTPEEIDVMRHREITSKAVSAILILTLKWFKVSHVMKFHHLGQLLLDSNCLLLILKMFGLQEVPNTVVTKNDVPDSNFFRYCYLNFSKNAHQLRPEDYMLSKPKGSRPSASATSSGFSFSMLSGIGGSSGPGPVPGTNPGAEENGLQEDDVELITDYSWRNFFASINFVKVMQKLSKQRSHRIWLLVQYKSSAILKRILKVSHPMLQLHVLKLIKSQVPFCGRKWRQTNMKVITSIYLNCRPDLRDEWLTGTEVEDVSDAMAQEQALRTLVKFYNSKRYGASIQTAALNPSHRRASSQSIPMLHELGGGDAFNLNRAGPSPKLDADVFPPLKSRTADQSTFLPYTGEDIAFEAEYEDYLSDLGEGAPEHHLDPLGFGLPGESSNAIGSGMGGTVGPSAWHRLATFPTDITDAISDSESVVSIGDLGDARGGDGSVSDDSDSDSGSIDENLNNWEHMSPKTFKRLPKSPSTGRRRSSGGAGLRPVIPFGLDDGSALDEEEYDEPEMGPMPTGRSQPFAAGEGGKGIDEVEYMYQE